MSNDKVSEVLPGDRSVIGEAESAKAKRAKANAKQIAGVAGIVVAGCGVFYLSMRTPVVVPPLITRLTRQAAGMVGLHGRRGQAAGPSIEPARLRRDARGGLAQPRRQPVQALRARLLHPLDSPR